MEALIWSLLLLYVTLWIIIVARDKRCPHERVRCTHGDEIIGMNFKRRVCLDCGRALDGPLPEPCTVTGRPHA